LINSRLYLQKVFFVIGIILLYCGIFDANAVVVSLNDTILSTDFTSDSLNNTLNLALSDTLALDSTQASTIDSVPEKKKEMLDAEVQYQARDSIVFLMDGTGYLYGDGKVKYMQAKPIELQAEYIRFKLDSSTVYAIGTTDSLGNSIGDPVFNDGNESYSSKYMSYNFKTKKAYVRRVVTQQDEGYIIAD
jgi:hypothetical protein